jgi:3-oxoacyl-[acyl-carrier-protein] synthase-3
MKEVDALISVSGTQAQLVPCTASLVLEELGDLDSGVAAFDINATCLGFIVGLDTASHLIAAGRHTRVVLVASETCSVMLSPTEWESASLIGDGAAAVVLERAGEGETSCVVSSRMETYARGAPMCATRALGTTLHPNGSRKPTEEDYYFHMEGMSLLTLTYDLAPGFRDRFMSEAAQSLSDFDLIVPHQASGPAVRLMSRRFECADEKVFVYLKDFGNVASASIPLGIHLALERGRLHRGDRVLLVGTGAGLSLGALSLVY